MIGRRAVPDTEKRGRAVMAPTETEWARRVRRERERADYIAEHGNVCELCGNPPKSRGLSEDHDHATGEHRGWLCYRCNRALPTYVDAAWLVKALSYLGRAS